MSRIALYIILPLFGVILGWLIRWLYAKFQLSSTEQRAARLSEEAVKEAEAKSREIQLETRDQLLKERHQQERENRERRNDCRDMKRGFCKKKKI